MGHNGNGIFSQELFQQKLDNVASNLICFKSRSKCFRGKGWCLRKGVCQGDTKGVNGDKGVVKPLLSCPQLFKVQMQVVTHSH